MTHLAWPVVLALLLAGCGLAERARLQEEAAAARKVLDAEVAVCEKTYPSATQKPIVPRLKCMSDASVKYAARTSPDVDLLHLMTAKVLVAGERYDAGRMTTAEFEASKAAAIADFNTNLLQRRNSATIANAARAQASAAQRQAAAAQQQAITAAIPRSTTCMTVGNMVTCY